MRKVLLLSTMFLMSLGINAAPFSSWSSGDANSYVVTGAETPQTQTIEVNKGGALAAFLDATNFNYDLPEGRKKLIIKGELSSADFAAIKSSTITKWSVFAEIDLSEASFTLSDMNGMALENLEYIILPDIKDDSHNGKNGFSGEQMAKDIAGLNANNPKLKIAASLTYDKETLPTWTGSRGNRSVTTTEEMDTKRLALYSWEKNSVQGFVNKYGAMAADINKLDMAGSYGEEDLWKVNTNAANKKVFTSTKLHYFDFTGATFEEGITISYTTKEDYNGTWDSNSGNMTGAAKITVTTTNALYYLRNYAEDVYTCKLPTGNTEIPPGLFAANDANTEGLMEIEIPEGYTSIGTEAFYGVPLKSLTLPSSITNVDEGAFYECRSLVDVEMSALDNNCSFASKCFMFCTNLKHFTMGEGVTDIADQMFEQCWNLEYIRIPSTCEFIGNRAFFLNMSLHSVTIPEGVQRIEHQAFVNSGLTDVYLLATDPNKLPKIYAVTGFYHDPNSSFTRKDIIGNDTPALQNDGNARALIAASHSNEVPAYYQEALSGGRYLGANQCLVNLHYPEALSNFINGVNVDGAPSLSQFNRLNGKTNISDEYQFTDLDGHKWPSQDEPTQDATDYKIRFAAGNVQGQTIYGWRQFALSSGKTTNYSKEFDETWYTICFPWNVSDTQLFEAFNQKCEIVEFKGAEVIADNNEANAYNLVLHFDEVAEAHYMDYVGYRYNRYDDGTYTITTPVTVTFPKYRYVRLDDNGNEVSGSDVTFNPEAAVGSTENNLYYQIENILAVAGHPYMIHPASVEHQGRASICTIAGVRRVATTNAELTYLEEKGKVTRKATTGNAQTEFTSPLGGGGTYTFHGYLGRDIEADGYKEDNDKSDIPQYSYFLAVPDGQKYPKYYREIANPATGKWTLYTAIVTPDQNAIDNIEALDGARVQNSANVAFGEWEQVEATAIEQIIADAQERGEEVREIHMNVVYNINGQVVRTDGQIEGLPKGLYIVNGKKYMVK